MDVFVRLIEIYNKYGIRISGGLFPWHFERNYPIGTTRLHVFQPFMGAAHQGKHMSVGGGISPLEVLVLSSVSRATKPKRIFLIGNAFGWSTLALGLANPDAQVVAIDALVEGVEAARGFDITQQIIKKEKLDNISVVEAFSPDDVHEVCQKYFDGPIDFALIDGKHSNEQQTKDFQVVYQELADPGVVFLHDVLNWNMISSFNEIRKSYPHMTGEILIRTPSGMGVFHTKTIPKEAKDIIDSFCESKDIIQVNRNEVAKRVRKARKIMGFGIQIKDDWRNKETSISFVQNEAKDIE